MSGRLPTQSNRRRDFLRGLARYTAIASLGGMLVVITRNRRRPGKGAECLRQFACGHCPQLRNCELPQADDFRRNS